MSDLEPGRLNHTSADPPDPLEFFVNSWNRFDVLRALAATPRTQAEIREETGLSRPTVSRILSDLVDRSYAIRLNDEYEASRRGEVIASELEQCIENIETTEALGSALDWLRTEDFGFPLGHLRDGTILTPSPEDKTGPMRNLQRKIEATSEMRVLANGLTYEVVDAICNNCLAGDLKLQCVVDDKALRGTRTYPELAEMIATMIDEAHCNVYHYEGDDELLAYNLIDDELMFCGTSGGGLPLGILVTKDETVRSWAAFNFERRKEQATPLPASAFEV